MAQETDPLATAPVESKKAPAKSKKARLTTSEKARYEAELKGAKSYQAQDGRVAQWKRHVRVLRHKYLVEAPTEDTPIVNITAARVRAQPPKLAFGIPNFDCTYFQMPPDPNSEVGTAAAVEMIWQQEGMDKTARRITLDFPTFGFGVGFVGYEDSFDGDVLSETRRLFGFLPSDLTSRIADFTGGMSDVLAARETTSTKMLLRQHVFLERVSPFDFLIDPCCAYWEQASFMARRIHMPLERAQLMFGSACPKAESIGNVAVYSDPNPDDTAPFAIDAQDKRLVNLLPDAVKRVDTWEMWNILTRKVIYHDSKGKVIGNEKEGDAVFDWKSPHPNFPFIGLLWDETPDCPYPTGLADALESGNDELNTIRKRQLQSMKRAQAKLRVPKGLTPAQRKALKSERDGELVEMSDEEYDSINYIERPLVQGDSFAAEDRVKRDMDEVSNTSPYEAASMPAVSRTATESSFVQNSSDAMTSFRQMAVEQFASHVAERIAAYLFTIFDEPIPVRIANQDQSAVDEAGTPVPIGTQVEYDYIGVDHAGFVKFATNPGSMASSAKDVERNQFMQVAQQLWGEPFFNRLAAAEHMLSLMPSIRDPKRFINKDTEQQVPPDQAVDPAAAQQQPAPAGDQAQDPQLAAMLAQMAPPAPTAQMPLASGPGSGNPTADLMAAVHGGQAPGTGLN